MNLTVKPSQISDAGVGLFTDEAIAMGTQIVEYTGRITTWAEVKDDWRNVYIYFITEDHVIDAKNHPECYARYANDAEGITKIKGLVNNAEFINAEGRVYITAIKDIPAGGEILVSYGEDYWETVRQNLT